MSILDSNGIFHSGDSEELLNYVNLRLKAGDLSSEEVQAMMSAVHAELGKGSTSDPRVYQLYSNTLKTIKQTMPTVYDYMVATWNRLHEKNLIAFDDDVSNIDGDTPGENKSLTVDIEREEGIYRINTLEEEFDKTDGEGLEELEEKETDEVEEKVVDPEQEEREEEPEEVNEEGSVKIEEEQPDENQEAGDITNESLQETDTNESGKDEEEEPETENKNEDNNVETDEDSILEEVVNESPEGTEKFEPERLEGENQAEEMEWPELEQPLPEKPIEGRDGGETSTEPEE
jgi:mannan polymerase II complex ANP1 subunit/KRAB domain-containing zinc finger protein